METEKQTKTVSNKYQYATSAIFLAFDFGMRRIGVAVGQRLTATATPLAPLYAKEGEPKWEEIANLIKRWEPAALVVGVPVHLDGTEQKITLAAQQFIAKLHKRFGLPVYAAEERLTTKAARERIFDAGGYRALQQESVDSLAAKLILEEWMSMSYEL